MAGLILARHGRTAHNAGGLLLGRLDPPLDEVGEAQAQALARTLGPVDLVVSSPLARARQTAGALDCAEVVVDERFVEIDYGSLDGTPISEVPTDLWERWHADPHFVPAGGESLAEVTRRVGLACEEWAQRAMGETVVVVSHVSPLKAGVAWALGGGVLTAWRLHVAPASITRIAIGERGPVLHSFNETSHLS